MDTEGTDLASPGKAEDVSMSRVRARLRWKRPGTGAVNSPDCRFSSCSLGRPNLPSRTRSSVWNSYGRTAPRPCSQSYTSSSNPAPSPRPPRHTTVTVRHNYVSIARIWKYLAAWSESIKMHYRYSAYYNALLTRNWQQTSTETNCNTSLNLHDGR